jgi:hypothetical protein
MWGAKKAKGFWSTLSVESLESRAMLSSVTADSPWQNPLDPADLNGDGSVTPSDALAAINAINNGGGGDLAAAKIAPSLLEGSVKEAASTFLDVDGDGHLAAGDALAIINTINLHLPHGLFNDLPTTDQQPEAPGADASALTFNHGFAKAIGEINADGDVDVFQITPAKPQLSVALFSASGGVMTVQILASDGTTVIGAPASTTAGSHGPAKVTAAVNPNDTYYIRVSGGSGVTGIYGLTALNYDDQDFTPKTDSPLGTDSHGNTNATASILQLNHGVGSVISNIDAAGDADVFSVAAVDGKLVVESDAAFPLNVQLTDENGKAIPTILSTQHVMIANVTAGTYYVSVAAANGADTGAYHLLVVDGILPNLGGGVPLPLPHLPTPEELYAKLDVNNDSNVTPTEWQTGIPLVGKTMLADHIFTNWDTDNSGGLSLDEFVTGLAKLPLVGNWMNGLDKPG